MNKLKPLGWFTGGGFRKDPALTEADKRYYEKQLQKYPKSEKQAWGYFHEKFGKEQRKVDEIIKKKDNKALSRWLKEFSRGTSFWFPKDTKNKFDKEDWL